MTLFRSESIGAFAMLGTLGAMAQDCPANPSRGSSRCRTAKAQLLKLFHVENFRHDLLDGSCGETQGFYDISAMAWMTLPPPA